MTTVNEILNFHFSPAQLKQAAQNYFSSTSKLTRELNSGTEKLIQLTEKIGERQYKFSGENLIPGVFRKFKAATQIGNNSTIIFERRELRTLAYAISYSEHKIPSIFSEENELEVLFSLFNENWKDSYLLGLIDCYLRNWQTQNRASFEKLGKFILSKLNTYEGTRAVLKSLKTNIRFFGSKNGDVTLGSELAFKNQSIKKSTKYLTLPDNWFSYAYFSKVIVAYYEKIKSKLPSIIDELEIALNGHNNSITNKRIVSKIIIQCNTNEFQMLQDKVKSIAFNFVGDPANVVKWSVFEGATETEISELKQARNILNQWITRKFITVFFEKCINDPRRKKFWLKLSKEIMRFRIVGSSMIKSMLLNDNRISEYVSARFCKTNSYSDRNSALMLVIKNYLFIEFSDSGAFYAYKLSNPHTPSIEITSINSTSELKNSSMKQLVYRSGRYITQTYDEGRLSHHDGNLNWEDVFADWIKKYVGINV